MSAVHGFPIDDTGSPVGCEEDLVSARWAAMHKVADALAKMLGQDLPSADRACTLYPAGLPQRDVAVLEVATADLCAMMKQGLFAVLRARENGAEAKIAAKTLLRRFEVSRRALLTSNEDDRDQDEADLAA